MANAGRISATQIVDETIAALMTGNAERLFLLLEIAPSAQWPDAEDEAARCVTRSKVLQALLRQTERNLRLLRLGRAAESVWSWTAYGRVEDFRCLISEQRSLARKD
jgi:hypothetical protein